MEILFGSMPEHKKKIVSEMVQFIQTLHSSGIDCTAWKSQEWKGYHFPPMFSPETARKFFEEVEIEDNTIFLASFPKTGTNWMIEIVRQIVFGGDEKLNAMSKLIPPILGMIEFWKPEKLQLYEHVSLPRKLFVTHLPEGLVNFEKMKKAKAKIIIPVRNPKDQAISWFHFAKHRQFVSIREKLSPDWSQFLSDYVQGKHPLITKPGEWYPDYLLEWYKYKDEGNLLFVHFEDMKNDPESGIKKMARFLDVELTDDRVADIAKATSFDSMRKAQEVGNTEVAKMQSDMKMMRKGEAGGWKNIFTVAQSEMVDKIIEEKLGHTDIKFRFN